VGGSAGARGSAGLEELRVFDRWPAFHPTAPSIAISEQTEDGWDISTTHDLKDGTRTRVTSDGTARRPGLDAPDGRSIVYTSTQPGAQFLEARRLRMDRDVLEEIGPGRDAAITADGGQRRSIRVSSRFSLAQSAGAKRFRW
jgi:Tol biopolymer transport system component